MILARPAARPVPVAIAAWPLGRSVDRLAVRTLVAGRLGPEWLPPLHGCWREAKDILWDGLPRGFLLSASRGPGRRLLVPDRHQAALRQVARLAGLWLRQEPAARLLAEAPPAPGSQTWEVLVRGSRTRALRPAGGSWANPALAPSEAQALAAAAEALSAGLLQVSVAFGLGGPHPLFLALRTGAHGAD